jgi:hypothetical protein
MLDMTPQERRWAVRRFWWRALLLVVAACLIYSTLDWEPENIRLAAWGCIVTVGVVLDLLLYAISHYAIHRPRRLAQKMEAMGAVGPVLDCLPAAQFQVFHGVACPLGPIEHIVLTRSGAMVIIATKTHQGKFTFTDKKGHQSAEALEMEFIRPTLKHVLWLEDLVKRQTHEEVVVSGVICFTQGLVELRQPSKNIRVTTTQKLVQVVQSSRNNQVLADWLWENFRGHLTSLPVP